MPVDLLALPPDPVLEQAPLREAEIARLSGWLLPPELELRRAELELASAVDAVVRASKQRAAKCPYPTTCSDIPRPMPDGVEAAWDRYEALLVDAPDTPGLERAIVRAVALDMQTWHRMAGPHGEEAVRSRLDRWAAAYPASEAVVAAELLYFDALAGYCHMRRWRDETAARLAEDVPALDRVLALDERLARVPHGGAEDFERWLGVRDGLVYTWEEACRERSTDYRCHEPWIVSEQRAVDAIEARAIPVYAAIVEKAPGGPEAGTLFHLLQERDDLTAAEAVAQAAEEAGAYERALHLWYALLDWKRPTDPAALARELRAEAHAAALAERIGTGDTLAALGQRVEEHHPRDAAGFYLRALAVGDRGGTYVYMVPAGKGRDEVLGRLARAWRRAGAHEEGAAWFRAQGRLDVWERSGTR